MDREKEIEEMARDIFAPKVAIDGIDIAFASVHGADKPDSHFMRIAQHLYNAGYRKQSEGEWKILKMRDGEKVRTCSACLISQTVNVYKGKVMFRYCPYCGAKMKGGE